MRLAPRDLARRDSSAWFPWRRPIGRKAQDSKFPGIAPEAKARLDALIASYRALPAYADHGEVTLVVKVGDRALKQSQNGEHHLRQAEQAGRPDRPGPGGFGDGSTLTSSVAPLKKYFVGPSPKKFAESSLRSGPLGSIEFGGVSGLPLVHVLNLVIGDDPERLIYDFTPKVLAEADQVVDGVSYKSSDSTSRTTTTGGS